MDRLKEELVVISTVILVAGGAYLLTHAACMAFDVLGVWAALGFTTVASISTFIAVETTQKGQGE